MPASFAQSADLPNLQSFIPQASGQVSAPAAPAVSDPSPVAAVSNGSAPPQPAAVVPPAQPQLAPPNVGAAAPAMPAPAAPAPSSASTAAQELTQRGFSIPSDWDNKRVFDTLAQQIDDANAIRDEYNPHREEFQQWLKTQQDGPPAGSVSPQPAEPNATPAQSVLGAEPPTSTLGTGLHVSDEAQMLANQGYLTRGENGWEARNPAFQTFADEHNRVEAQRLATLSQFSNDPDGYITQRVQQLGMPDNGALTTLQDEVKELREQLQLQHNSTQEAEVDSWIDDNAQQLFVNGDRNQGYTPYAQRYNAISERLSQMAQQMGQQLSRAQLHENTRKMLEIEQPQQPQQPQLVEPANQPAMQPVPQQQSFIQQAASAPPRDTTNRLTEYPAQQPNGNYVPTGKRRLPSLEGLIQQNQRNANTNAF